MFESSKDDANEFWTDSFSDILTPVKFRMDFVENNFVVNLISISFLKSIYILLDECLLKVTNGYNMSKAEKGRIFGSAPLTVIRIIPTHIERINKKIEISFFEIIINDDSFSCIL